MKIPNTLKKIFAALMAVSVLTCALPVSAFAEENFTKSGNVLMSASNKLYYLNTIGGVKAYIPLDLSRYSRDANRVRNAFTTDISITSSEGSMANTAAFRYGGFGTRYANLFRHASTNVKSED